MHPFNVITLDLITQLPKANGHDAILMVIDQGSSRAAIFITCNTMITGEGVAVTAKGLACNTRLIALEVDS